MNKIRSMCVFCGSTLGTDPEYRRAARDLGHFLAGRGITLVYGGGKVGLMGEIAQAVLQQQGRAIGVMPQWLITRELAHDGLTQLYITDTMHARKNKMHELADGYIALPGGYGTYEEIFETLSWLQIGIHEKPVGLLNVNGYFDPLLRMLQHTVEQGFAKPEALALVITAEDPETLLLRMERFVPYPGNKWA